jgi:hypothetical protein
MSLFSSIPGIMSGLGGLASAGASIYGGIQGGKAADKAGKMAERAYQQQRADLAPQRQLGQESSNMLRDIYVRGDRDFTQSPGYQFRVDEGRKAMERSAAARGMLNSGGMLRQLQEYGQGAASQEYGNQFNRLAHLAGLGAGPTAQGVQAAGNMAINVGNAGANAAAARTSGFQGASNALNTFGENISGLNLLRRLGYG